MRVLSSAAQEGDLPAVNCPPWRCGRLLLPGGGLVAPVGRGVGGGRGYGGPAGVWCKSASESLYRPWPEPSTMAPVVTLLEASWVCLCSLCASGESPDSVFPNRMMAACLRHLSPWSIIFGVVERPEGPVEASMEGVGLGVL